MYKIMMTKEFGRGLYATRNIKRGELITRCELLVLSPEDTLKVNETDLKYYTFVYDSNTKQDCLVLGDGEIFNHSDVPNTAYFLTDYNGCKIMIFSALKDIREGDQLFTDYNADTKVDVTEYIENKSLI